MFLLLPRDSNGWPEIRISNLKNPYSHSQWHTASFTQNHKVGHSFSSDKTSRPCRLKPLFRAMISTPTEPLNKRVAFICIPLFPWNCTLSSTPQGTLVIYPVTLHEGTVYGPQSEEAGMIQHMLLSLTLGWSAERGAHSQEPSSLEHSLGRREKGFKMPEDQKGKKGSMVRNPEGV